MFKDIKTDKKPSFIPYKITLALDKIYIDDSGNKASVRVITEVFNSEGSGILQVLPLELMKKDDKWFVIINLSTTFCIEKLFKCIIQFPHLSIKTVDKYNYPTNQVKLQLVEKKMKEVF